MKHKNCLIYTAIVVILTAAAFSLGRFLSNRSQPEAHTLTSPENTQESTDLLTTDRPIISAKRSQEDTTIPAEYFSGNYSKDICYYGLCDVTIQLDDETLKLEDAIRDGRITVEELAAYARIDAREGVCGFEQKTVNGLTVFIYRYPEYQLEEVYDVYETPDGKQHVITQVDLHYTTYQSGGIRPLLTDENGWIDQEDWGLTFELISADSTSVTLQSTQSGGQQIGYFTVDSFAVCSEATEAYLEVGTSGGNIFADPPQEIPISMEGSGALTIDWSDAFGPLSPGRYTLRLVIADIYDPEQVHPLMKNYWDYQSYYIDFTVE